MGFFPFNFFFFSLNSAALAGGEGACPARWGREISGRAACQDKNAASRVTPGPVLPLPLSRCSRILGEAVARLRGCCGLWFCLFQNKKAASEGACCFAKIAKGACAAAPPVQIILHSKLSRANSAVRCFPSQRGAAARAWERVREAHGEQRPLRRWRRQQRSESLPTCSSPRASAPQNIGGR